MIDSSSAWVLLLLLTKVQTLPHDTISNSKNSKMPFKLFEGDIILSAEQQQILSDMRNPSKKIQQRNCLLDTKFRWPQKTVLYRLNDYKKDNVDTIKSAMSKISGKSCVKFQEAAENATAYVNISNNNPGCYSSVGYSGSVQICNLDLDGCMDLGTIIHEMLHVIGFYHQQSSSNRDSYLNIHLENVDDDKKHNFIKYPNDTVTDFGLPYDYDSIMHYNSKAFSKNDKETMTPIDPKVKIVPVYLKTSPSDIDIQKIKRMYECGAK